MVIMTHLKGWCTAADASFFYKIFLFHIPSGMFFGGDVWCNILNISLAVLDESQYRNMTYSLNLNCLAGFLCYQQYDPTYNWATYKKHLNLNCLRIWEGFP